MVFVGKGEASDDALFERRLFLMRKAAEDQGRGADDAAGHQCHMVSLSARTLIYKGMLLADQMAAFFPDLGHPAMASALALVHQRYSTTRP
jgi:glutamate synthase domain-containing protein 1